MAGGVALVRALSGTAKAPPPAAVPNMTGVVTATFNEQVNDAALAQQQAKTSALEQNFATLSQQFEQNKLDTNEKIARKDAEIQRLTEQLNQRPAGSNPQTPPADQNGTPLRVPLPPASPARRILRDPDRSAPASGAVNMGQGAAFYPGAPDNV